MSLPAWSRESVPAAIRVLIVDDTVVYRKVLCDAVAAIEGAEVAATAPSGELALRHLKQKEIDLVLLDIEMPGMDGLATLAHIVREHPRVAVVMVSGVDGRGATRTLAALDSGALEFIAKPTGKDASENSALLCAELKRVLRMVGHQASRPATTKVLPLTQTASSVRAPARDASTRDPSAAAGARSSAQRALPAPRRYGVLGIGISTGGPRALGMLLPALPADFPLPVLIVQHMPANFTKALSEDLDRKSLLEVREAANGDRVQPGRILIAPGDRHMTVVRSRGQVQVLLNDGPRENGCRPAVDVLFRSMASAYPTQGVLAAIMTGMGSDGLNGVMALKKVGCRCLTQDAASCTVYGMPQAIDAAGLSEESVGLEQLAGRLTALARASGRAA